MQLLTFSPHAYSITTIVEVLLVLESEVVS
jgi:hypothetical protein